MLGREATSAVMFIPLIVLYISATGAILFSFCNECIKSCRNNTDTHPIPERKRPGRREVKQGHRGSGYRNSQEVEVHISRSHSKFLSRGRLYIPTGKLKAQILFHKLPGMHETTYYEL